MVFALNTVVGFACAIGVDMSFNSPHHQQADAQNTIVHVHKNGKKHEHQQKKESHHQHTSPQHVEKDMQQEGADKDNCCNTAVTQFNQLDKAVPPSTQIFHPVFFTPVLAFYDLFQIKSYENVVINKKQFVRSHHPPIPDIRLAIRSFQI